jgi:hypothetical protein
MSESWCEKNGASFDIVHCPDGDLMIEVERRRDAWETDRVSIFVSDEEAIEILHRITSAVESKKED